jgi:hemerythrin
MTHLVWTDDLNTGIPVIDGQHRQIVDYINQLHDARLKNDRQAVGDVINNLIDYTLSHFSFEEELMVESGYPFAGPHKRVHDVFVKRVGEYQLRYKSGEDISGELHALLMRWLVGHIKNDDAAYATTVMAHTHSVAHQKSGWLARTLGRLFR